MYFQANLFFLFRILARVSTITENIGSCLTHRESQIWLIRTDPGVIKLFSRSTQLSMKFILLIIVKIVGIFYIYKQDKCAIWV